MSANFYLKNKNLVKKVLLLSLIFLSNSRYTSFKVYLQRHKKWLQPSNRVRLGYEIFF